MTTADDLVAASRVLTDYFIDFEVDARLLRQLLAEHPDLVTQAGTWGWDETEVRGKLAGIVSRALLDRSWPTYGAGEVIDDFSRDLHAAHARWVQHADAT